MRLLLIRHGQTPNNVVGALDTAYPGAGLSSLGLAQAAAIPRVLADESIGGIYASKLIRTQLTATPLARSTELGIQIVDGVQEISAGDFEMRNDDDAVAAYVGALKHWANGDIAFTLSGGESGHDFFARYDAAIERIASQHADGTAVVVSHGAAIRVWAAGRAGNVQPQQAIQRGLHNTGLFALEGDPERGWNVVRWHEEPLGGLDLEDPAAHDVTGDPEEAHSATADDA